MVVIELMLKESTVVVVMVMTEGQRGSTAVAVVAVLLTVNLAVRWGIIAVVATEVVRTLDYTTTVSAEVARRIGAGTW